jgi:molybdate transport system substrate-binding protein
MRVRSLLLLALALAPGKGLAQSNVASRLSVFAAASLTDAFRELGKTLERRQPGLRIDFNFAGSQQLALQMEEGAPADVFASADERWMVFARDSGLVAGESRVFAHNRLIVIVPASNPARIGRLQDLARAGAKVVVAAPAVPAGFYTREMLNNLSRSAGFDADFAKRTLANVVSQESNVKGVVVKIQLGEADAGVVYVSDVSPALSRYVRTIEIPEAANALANYPIAVVKNAPNAAAARVFIDLVMSAEGQAVLGKYKFIPVDVK